MLAFLKRMLVSLVYSMYSVNTQPSRRREKERVHEISSAIKVEFEENVVTF